METHEPTTRDRYLSYVYQAAAMELERADVKARLQQELEDRLSQFDAELGRVRRDRDRLAHRLGVNGSKPVSSKPFRNPRIEVKKTIEPLLPDTPKGLSERSGIPLHKMAGALNIMVSRGQLVRENGVLRKADW